MLFRLKWGIYRNTICNKSRLPISRCEWGPDCRLMLSIEDKWTGDDDYLHGSVLLCILYIFFISRIFWTLKIIVNIHIFLKFLSIHLLSFSRVLSFRTFITHKDLSIRKTPYCVPFYHLPSFFPCPTLIEGTPSCSAYRERQQLWWCPALRLRWVDNLHKWIHGGKTCLKK